MLSRTAWARPFGQARKSLRHLALPRYPSSRDAAHIWLVGWFRKLAMRHTLARTVVRVAVVRLAVVRLAGAPALTRELSAPSKAPQPRKLHEY